MRGPYASAEVETISNLVGIISIYLLQIFTLSIPQFIHNYVSLLTVTEYKLTERFGCKFILTKYFDTENFVSTQEVLM
jgi:small basic protein